jgi:hypothetical protein
MSIGLGGATFQVRADPAQFQQGMKRAKEEAVRSSQQIGAAVQTINSQTATGLVAASRSVDTLDKSFKKLGTTVGGAKGGHLGLGMLAIGQMVDDMQYGFRSIVNNIPQVTYLMGGSAGLAGAIGIAAVGANLLISHWDELMDSMQARWLNVATSDLERLRIATEKAGEAFDTLMKTPSELGARELSKLKEAITDLQKGGGAGLFAGLANAVALEPGMRAEETPDELKKRRVTEGAIRRLEDPKHRPMLGEPDVAELRKDVQAMDEKLAAQNRMMAKTLIGRALQAGEEGDVARSALKRLVEKFSGSFTPEFRAALQKITPARIQSEIDLENAKKARQHASGTAGSMLSGPIGTRLMLGGGESGPASPEELAKLAGGSTGRRFARAGVGDLKEQLATAGLSSEQIRSVLQNMTIQKTNERIKKEVEAQGNKFNPLSIPAGILHDVYKKMLTEQIGANKGKPSGTEASILKTLKAAGVVGQDPKEVLQEMKAQLADRRKELMLGGMSSNQAKAQILREQQQRAFPQSMQPAQWVGITQLAKMGSVNAQGQGIDLQKRSLDELVAIRKGLVFLREQNLRAAVAAGPN